MKKRIALVLSLGLLLALLAGCEMFVPDQMPTPNYALGGNETGSPEGPEDSADPAENLAGGADEYGFTVFPAGNYLADKKFDTDEFLPDYDADPSFNHKWSDGFELCRTEDTIYSFYDGVGVKRIMITYTDKATGISGPLCGRPECLHEDETCNAYVHDYFYGYSFSLCTYGGKLYWIDGGSEIVRTNLDGTDRETVCRVWAPEYEINYHSTVLFHRGYVYYATAQKKIVNGEEKAAVAVKAQPLDGGEGFVVWEKTVDGSASAGIRCHIKFVGNILYIMLTDYDYIELCRWDSKTRQGEFLYSEAEPDGILYSGDSFLPVSGDGIYFAGEGRDRTEDGYYVQYAYKYSFADGEIKTVMTFNEEEDRVLRTAFYALYFTKDYIVAVHIAWLDDENFQRTIHLYDYDRNPVLTKDIGRYGVHQFLGADGDYIYFFSLLHEYFGNNSAHQKGDFIFAPLDGGELTVIPGFENNWVEGTLV